MIDFAHMPSRPTKGQVSIIAVILTATTTVFASLIGAWTTSASNLGDVKESVAIVQERESNHYDEVQKRLNSMDSKLDRLLERGVK